MKHTLHTIWVFLFFSCLSWLHGQDIHFSQFYNNPVHLNPALTGAFRGEQRFASSYREQWQSVPVSYLTFSGTYDRKFTFPWLKQGFFGGGILFNYDRAGDANLNWVQLGLNASYFYPINEEHYVSAGFQIMTGQRALNPDLLSFDAQFNGDIFDAQLPTLESFPASSTSFFDLSTGINWFYKDEDTRSNFFIGLSYNHLTRPTIGFLDIAEETQLAPLINLHGIYVIQLADKFDLPVNILFQSQGPYQETLFGSGLKFHLNQEAGKQLALAGGLSYRLQDAFIPNFELYYKNWVVGLSYDINNSDFTEATNGQGGPEITVQYVIFAVKPPKLSKPCPIF